jgi:tRNA (guanine37-N1)-methyltransferase
MKFDILTLFPEMFVSPLQASILGKAAERGLVETRIINIRDFAVDKHRVVDDTPYGGGQGMVMKVEPIARALESVKSENSSAWTIYLTGGELAAMVVMDCISRLLPGVLGSEESADDDSFSNFLLEYPQYTRPFDFKGHCVPEVLVSGNHSEIALWRRREALKRTLTRRPDLLTKAHLSEKDEEFLGEVARHLKTGTERNGV